MPVEGEEYSEDEIEGDKYFAYEIIDNQDGSYHVNYEVDEPCEVIIDVRYLDERGGHVPIRGVPFVAAFSKEFEARNNELTGP